MRLRLPLLLAAALLAHAACAIAAHDSASLPLKDVDRFKDKEPITDKSMLGVEPKMKGLESYDPAKRLNPLEEGLGYAEQQKPVTLKPEEALKNQPGKGADDSTAKSEGITDGLSITDDDGIVEPRYLRYGSYQQPVYTQPQQPVVQQPLIGKSDTVVPAQFSAADEGAARFARGFGGGWGRGIGGWGGARALRGGWGRGFGGWGRGYGWGRGFGYGGLGYGGLYGGYYGAGYPYYGGYGYGIGYPYTTYYTAPYYGAGYYGYGFPAYRGFYGGRRFGRWW